jgi:cystathionine beta-lyase
LNLWFARRFATSFDPAWLVKCPGVVYALATAVRAFTKVGESVMIQQPVYPPFASVVTDNSRELVVNPLAEKNGRYEIDFVLFEKQLIEKNVKLFLFCSPHNPVGRVWTEDELRTLTSLCIKHGCLIVSDEIHCDFVYENHRHTILTSLSPDVAAHTVLCTAPSKTFNLAGLQVSNIFIPDEKRRLAFKQAIRETGYSQLNTMGLFACQAAYRDGAVWLDELLVYLKGNIDLVRSFLTTHLPDIKLIEPDGTYLLWLDFRALGKTPVQLRQWLNRDVGLWLNDGTSFGVGGDGFQRMNVACPRSVVEEAMGRLLKG